MSSKSSEYEFESLSEVSSASYEYSSYEYSSYEYSSSDEASAGVERLRPIDEITWESRRLSEIFSDFDSKGSLFSFFKFKKTKKKTSLLVKKLRDDAPKMIFPAEEEVGREILNIMVHGLRGEYIGGDDAIYALSLVLINRELVDDSIGDLFDIAVPTREGRRETPRLLLNVALKKILSGEEVSMYIHNCGVFGDNIVLGLMNEVKEILRTDVAETRSSAIHAILSSVINLGDTGRVERIQRIIFSTVFAEKPEILPEILGIMKDFEQDDIEACSSLLDLANAEDVDVTTKLTVLQVLAEEEMLSKVDKEVVGSLITSVIDEGSVDNKRQLVRDVFKAVKLGRWDGKFSCDGNKLRGLQYTFGDVKDIIELHKIMNRVLVKHNLLSQEASAQLAGMYGTHITVPCGIPSVKGVPASDTPAGP